MPKVSVIIPTFNRADMLGDALDSVLRQSYTDWEAIVVDDGSTDDTRALMARYTDPRIRYIYQTNTGLPGARNTGLRQAQGEFVALLDSDDVFLPQRLEKQVAIAEADPMIGLVAGGSIEVDKHLRPIREVQYWHTVPTLHLRDLVMVCPFCPSAVLLRRSWVERAGGFDESMKRIEDWDLWLRMSYAGCQCAWLREAACYYRIHGGNMVRDVALMRDGMVTMLDKLYAHTDLPADVVALRNPAYAHVYLNTAGRFYAAGAADEGKAALTQAIALDPGLLQGEPPHVLDSLAAFALMPLSNDAEKFMTCVMHNLPDNAPTLKQWSPARALGLVHAVAAFQSAQNQQSGLVVKHAWRAVRHHPAWLRNRGLMAVAGRALVGRVRMAKQTERGGK